MSNNYLLKQRERRKANNNATTKKYEKTKNGFLMRTYRNMKSRVTGVQKKKAHLYLGLSLMPKLDFYEWSTSDLQFHKLFVTWKNNGYDRKLTPSIDSSKGYERGNVRWITHSQNSFLGNKSRFSSQISTTILTLCK